jgi:hypothetical protein
LAAALGGFVTGYTLKLIEHRRDLRDSGRLEVIKKQHLERYQVISGVNGKARELYHQVGNVVLPRSFKHTFARAGGRSSITRISAEMREMARSGVTVVGERYVLAVHDVTDEAVRILEVDWSDDPTRELPPAFERAYNRLLDLGTEILGKGL